MRVLVRSILTLLLGLLLIVQCFGFGTGSPFDLTRTVLAEHGFRDTPIKIVEVENWLTDYYSSSPTYGDKHRTLEKLHFDNLFNDEQVKASENGLSLLGLSALRRHQRNFQFYR